MREDYANSVVSSTGGLTLLSFSIMAGPTDMEFGAGGSDDPGYYEAVGRAIRVLRTERGMERKELAEAAGLSYPYLSEIETGRKRPSSKALFVIAEALGVRPSEVLALGDRYGGRTSSSSGPPPASVAQALPAMPMAAAPSQPPAPAAFAGAPPARSAPGRGSRRRGLQRRGGNGGPPRSGRGAARTSSP